MSIESPHYQFTISTAVSVTFLPVQNKPRENVRRNFHQHREDETQENIGAETAGVHGKSVVHESGCSPERKVKKHWQTELTAAQGLSQYGFCLFCICSCHENV